jgi:hypothetical protein
MSEVVFNELGGAVSYINVAPNGKPAFNAGDVIIEGVFKKTFQGKFGLQHEFMVGTDKKVLNGFGSINYKLQDIEPNTTVRVVYNGKQKLTKGKMAGKDFHDCKLLVATNTIAMKEVSTDESNTNSDDASFLA